MADASRKRSADDVVDNISLYDDPTELVNAVIATLNIPEQKTVVSDTYANDKNLATEVQAYAKIAGNNWTYYVKSLSVSIGRNTDVATTPKEAMIDIDLGPAKVVSRQHASINYNVHTRLWELYVQGRNGAKVDAIKVACGPNSTPTPLYSGAVIDIGGTQMMFILPDAQPKVSQQTLDQVASRIPKPKSKKANNNAASNNMNGSGPYFNGVSRASATPMAMGPSTNMKAFHMFDDNSGPKDMGSSMDSDFSKDDARDIKPPYSYATMITQAILSNPDGVLSLSEIYDWISHHYAFYRFSKSGWQNSIRHNLSLNKAFEKVPRRPNEPGKGMKWQISDSYKDEFMKKFQNGSLSKARRGSSVSRQLQLHLAKHNDLPASQAHRQRGPSNQFTPPIQYQHPGFMPQDPHQQSHEALQFIASNVSSTGQPYQTQQGLQPPPQNGPYGSYPPQLPPLQQQPPHAQMPYPPPPPQQIPAHYAHSRGSSIGSAQFSAPYTQQLPPPQATQQLPQQPPQELQPLPKAEMQAQQPQPQQPPQQQQQQQPQEQIQENSQISDATKPTADSTGIIRPTTIDTSASEDRTEVKPETRGTPSELSSPIKPQMYPSGKFYDDPQGNSTTESKNENSNIDYGMIASPSKPFSVSAVEAYTPERGARKKSDDDSNGTGREGSANGGPNNNNLQSSPALWNFVQFSTPLGPGQGQDRREQPSPTKNGFQNIPDSPLKMSTEAKEGDGDELNVDLAKGFKKQDD